MPAISLMVGGDYNGLIFLFLEADDAPKGNRANLLLFKEYFQDNFYLGISASLLELENQINHQLIDLARANGVRLLGYNKVRYLDVEDAFACDLLEASLNGVNLSVHDEPSNPCYYLKGPNEISALFDENINANVDELIDLCQVDLSHMDVHLPQVSSRRQPDGPEIFERPVPCRIEKTFRQPDHTSLFATARR